MSVIHNMVQTLPSFEVASAPRMPGHSKPPTPPVEPPLLRMFSPRRSSKVQAAEQFNSVGPNEHLTESSRHLFRNSVIERHVPMKRLTLAFANHPEVEAKFRVASSNADLVSIRWSVLLYCAMVVMSCMGDWYREIHFSMFLIRMIVRASCVVLFVVPLVFSSMLPHIKWILTFVHIAFGQSFILTNQQILKQWVMSNDAEDGFVLIVVGLCLVMLNAAILSRLRFIQTLQVCFIGLVVFVVVGTQSSLYGGNTIDFAIASAQLLFVALLSSAASYQLERCYRIQYLRMLRHETERGDLTNRIKQLERALSSSCTDLSQFNVKSPMETILDKLKGLANQVQDNRVVSEMVAELSNHLSRNKNLWIPDFLPKTMEPDVRRFLFDNFFDVSTLKRWTTVEELLPSPTIRKTSDSTTLIVENEDPLSYLCAHNEPLRAVLYSQVGKWNMDAFYLSSISQHHPIQAIGMYLFQKLDFFFEFDIKQMVLRNFFEEVEKTYQHLPYHSAIHAADVANSLFYFLSEARLLSCLDSIEVMAAIVAAIVHDVGHPGVNNMFLTASRSDKAILYNDVSVLENFHISTAYSIMKDEKKDIFLHLNKDQWTRVRKQIVLMVLDTDMSKHFESLSHFRTRTAAAEFSTKQVEDRLLVLRMTLRCADIGHSAKKLDLHVKWSERIQEEFYNQGDLERNLGMPISGFCDRQHNDLNKSQSGFLEYVCIPLFQSYVNFLDVAQIRDECLTQLMSNKMYWSDGVNSQPTSPKKTFSFNSACSTSSNVTVQRSLRSKEDLSERD